MTKREKVDAAILAADCAAVDVRSFLEADIYLRTNIAEQEESLQHTQAMLEAVEVFAEYLSPTPEVESGDPEEVMPSPNEHMADEPKSGSTIDPPWQGADRMSIFHRMVAKVRGESQ